ncbi:hypothetical protein [Cryobacterium sp. 10C3]|uniref:hypothetical protein n=1 Tax=Cryobacterium sp. 10C3 TaxID=3048577 RepID=UPI002AB57B73|nr:hypothetical protein [Cryobacterium sp. 10C3]MDY7557140.1 hypothetical protein [Cryobacterium sp. 10C3]
MLVRSLAAPWEAGLSPAQYQLICYFVGMGALCFFVGFLRAWVTRGRSAPGTGPPLSRGSAS